MKLFTFFKVIWLHISCIFLSSPLQITEFNECTLCRRIIFKEPFYKIFIVSFFRLWKPSGKNTSSKLIKTVLFSFIGDTCDNNWFRCKTFSFYVEEKKCLVLLFVCIWPYSRTIHHQGLGVTWFWRQSPRNIFKSSWLMYSLGNSPFPYYFLLKVAFLNEENAQELVHNGNMNYIIIYIFKFH